MLWVSWVMNRIGENSIRTVADHSLSVTYEIHYALHDTNVRLELFILKNIYKYSGDRANLKNVDRYWDCCHHARGCWWRGHHHLGAFRPVSSIDTVDYITQTSSTLLRCRRCRVSSVRSIPQRSKAIWFQGHLVCKLQSSVEFLKVRSLTPWTNPLHLHQICCVS